MRLHSIIQLSKTQGLIWRGQRTISNRKLSAERKDRDWLGRKQETKRDWLGRKQGAERDWLGRR